MINITLPDNSIKKFKKGSTPMDIAVSISEGLARNILAAKVNGNDWDTDREILEDASLHLYTFNDMYGKMCMWHSTAHILAEALEFCYPGIKFGIGPAIETGFYYDVDPGEYSITLEDLPKIEKKMKELISNKVTFKRQEITKKDALSHFQKKKDQYKLELLQELKDGDITFYSQGNFIDLCKGPHIS